MSTINKSGSKISIGAMKYEGKSIAKKTFDLKGHEGERIKVHIGNDDKYTIESRPTQKLLICELDVPAKEYENILTTEKDENGEFIVEQKEKELELSKVGMKRYLEEGEIKTK